MLLDQEKCRALEKEVEGLADKLLEFMTKECRENGHSAGVCYVAMRIFLYRWIKIMGPEQVKKIESQFQIIPRSASIPTC